MSLQSLYIFIISKSSRNFLQQRLYFFYFERRTEHGQQVYPCGTSNILRHELINTVHTFCFLLVKNFHQWITLYFSQQSITLNLLVHVVHLFTNLLVFIHELLISIIVRCSWNAAFHRAQIHLNISFFYKHHGSHTGISLHVSYKTRYSHRIGSSLKFKSSVFYDYRIKCFKTFFCLFLQEYGIAISHTFGCTLNDIACFFLTSSQRHQSGCCK